MLAGYPWLAREETQSRENARVTHHLINTERICRLHGSQYIYWMGQSGRYKSKGRKQSLRLWIRGKRYLPRSQYSQYKKQVIKTSIVECLFWWRYQIWRFIDMLHFIFWLPRCISGKELACQCRRRKRCRFDPWVGKIPWRRACPPTPVFLPGESHGQRGLADYSPWSHKKLDMTEAT